MTEEYLTVAEVAARLKLSPKTVRNRMSDGTWQRGAHWFSRPGMRPRFKWSALVAWLEADPPQRADHPGAAYGPEIPRPRRGRPRTSLTLLQNKGIPGADGKATGADGAAPGVSGADAVHGAPRA